MVDLCAPHHPIVVNDLFCLSHPAVHTISVGAARVADLDLHLRAVALLGQAPELLPPILERLEAARREALGEPWLASWREGLPPWEETPGEINVPVLLWLHNLLEAWDLEEFCKARYSLLGQGGHWFPGENAEALDQDVSEAELQVALATSPWAECIPDRLRELRRRLGGGTARRLQME
jgi:predicted aldo/keto reductase-like oxidoreductase